MTLIEHVTPVKPEGHVHENLSTPSTQTPLLSHFNPTQSSIFVEHVDPEYPAAQMHAVPPCKRSMHVPPLAHVLTMHAAAAIPARSSVRRSGGGIGIFLQKNQHPYVICLE